MWPFDIKKKKRQIQKRRKVLLFTFIPITLIAIAIAIVLSLLFSCKPNSTITPPDDSSIITQKTIKEKNYMVPHNTDVFVSHNDTMEFGHDLFDLKA
jgi:flagellar basal body-associated protein FliL